MNNLDLLWEPIAIGKVSARNRISLPAHLVTFTAEQYGAYLGERARGGVGLIVTHGFAVLPTAARPGVSPWSRDWIPYIQKVMAPARAAGTPVFVQLTNSGVNATPRTDEQWGPLWAPSAIPSPVQRIIPKVMERSDIEALIEGFAVTASHVQEAGGDGIEIHGGHGYLLSGFLSPYWNRRTDEYGGDAERRARLVIEVAQAVRDRCGPDFAIGIKLNLDEYLGDRGTTPEDAAKTGRLLVGTGLFDYLCAAHTDYHNNHQLIPPASSGVTAPLAEGAGLLKHAIASRVPVLVQGSITDVETAASIVRKGQADVIGMARAHIADPQLVNKARAGRGHETRRCVGANQGCWRRLGQPISCTVNPLTGREESWGSALASRAAMPLKILVVGGGPAGLKCAETAAQRGHKVSLWERGPALGGQLRYAARLPDFNSWSYLVDDLARALERLSVDVRLNTEATLEAVCSFGADKIVVATGSSWDDTGFSTFRPDCDAIAQMPGAHVIDPITALDDLEACGDRIVIVDDNGDYLPLGLARLLTAQGKVVTIVSADQMIGRSLEATLNLPWVYPRALREGVQMVVSNFVERIEPGKVVLKNVWSADASEILADTVILSMMRRSEETLYEQIRDHGLDVLRVGDCVAPREVDDAIVEGLREAIAIG